MPSKKHVLIAVLACGLINGAIGSRLLISMPAIHSLQEVPFSGFLLMVPCMALYMGIVTVIFKRVARFFFLGMLILATYAGSYGLAELSFHVLNARPIFESLAALTLGSSMLLGLFGSEMLLSKRWAPA